MIYNREQSERNAAIRVAELMAAAARTAPKTRGIDVIETLILDGDDKDRLSTTMVELGKKMNMSFISRDGEILRGCHNVVLVGAGVAPRGTSCAFCGISTCEQAAKDGVSCALSVTDLGIAICSAAAVAMDHRMDNRILYSAGKGALELGLFPKNIKICYGIGLSTTGKSVFFDRMK